MYKLFGVKPQSFWGVLPTKLQEQTAIAQHLTGPYTHITSNLLSTYTVSKKNLVIALGYVVSSDSSFMAWASG